MLTNDEVYRLFEKLQGTADSLDNALAEMGYDFEDMSKENCELLDSQVALCASCEWWCETDELDEDSNCMNCQGE